MQLLEVKNDIAKILYSPSEVQLYLSDFLLIEDINQSLISQILEIESAHNDTSNIATVKLSLSINKNSNLSTYNGYIPSKESNIIYISPMEISQLIQSSKTNIYFGNLSSHPEIAINLGLNFLRDNAYIICDKIENTITINSNILYNLQHNRKRTVAIDFDGTYKKIPDVAVVKVGKDYKMPLNAEAFEFIIQNDLYECSVENKAFIQGILLELETYANSLDDKFIPFSLFKKVIEEQAKFNSIPELLILRNKILRYEQLGLFAELKEQFDILNDCMEKNTITVIDATALEEKFESFIIQTVASQIDKKSYFIVSLTDTNSSKKSITSIFENDKIRPVVSTPYSYKHSSLLKSLCKNLILFSPSQPRVDNEAYSQFLMKLRPQEFILYGENTFFMPFVLRLSAFDKSVFDMLTDTEIKSDIDKFLSQQKKESTINQKTLAECENELNISSPVKSVIIQEMTQFPQASTVEQESEPEIGLVEEADLNEICSEFDENEANIHNITDNDVITIDSTVQNEILQEEIKPEELEETTDNPSEILEQEEKTPVELVEKNPVQEIEQEEKLEIQQEDSASQIESTDQIQEETIQPEPENVVEATIDILNIQDENFAELSENNETTLTSDENNPELLLIPEIDSDKLISAEQNVISIDKEAPINEEIEETEQQQEIQPTIQEQEENSDDTAQEEEEIVESDEDITDDDLDFLDSYANENSDDNIPAPLEHENSIFEKYIEITNKAEEEKETLVVDNKINLQTPELQDDDIISIDDFLTQITQTEDNNIKNEVVIPEYAQKARKELMELLNIEEPDSKKRTVRENVQQATEKQNSNSTINEMPLQIEQEETNDNFSDEIISFEQFEGNNSKNIENDVVKLEEQVNINVCLNDDSDSVSSIVIDEKELEKNQELANGSNLESNNEIINIETILEQPTETEEIEKAEAEEIGETQVEETIPDEFKDLTAADIEILDNIQLPDSTLEEFKESVDSSDFVEKFIVDEQVEQTEQENQDIEIVQTDVSLNTTEEEVQVVSLNEEDTNIEGLINITSDEQEIPQASENKVIDLLSSDENNTENELIELANENSIEQNFEKNENSLPETKEEVLVSESENIEQTEDEKPNSVSESIQETIVMPSYNEATQPQEVEKSSSETLERRRTIEQSDASNTNPNKEKESTPPQEIPVYSAPVSSSKNEDIAYQVGDKVYHPKYGYGIVESFSHYSNKILFTTILFDDFGRRTLDAKLTGLEKV